MKTVGIRILVMMAFTTLMVGCEGENGTGISFVRIVPPKPSLNGSYKGVVTDITTHVSARLNVYISSTDSNSGIRGNVTIDGIPSCFSQGNFSGGYDVQHKTITIEALDSNLGSTAVLSFNHSDSYSRLFIKGGVSRIEISGSPCFIFDTAILSKPFFVPPEEP